MIANFLDFYLFIFFLFLVITCGNLSISSSNVSVVAGMGYGHTVSGRCITGWETQTGLDKFFVSCGPLGTYTPSYTCQSKSYLYAYTTDLLSLMPLNTQNLFRKSAVVVLLLLCVQTSGFSSLPYVEGNHYKRIQARRFNPLNAFMVSLVCPNIAT